VTGTTEPLRSHSGGAPRLSFAAAFAMAGVITAAALSAQPAQAQAETVLHSFRDGPRDGQLPSAGLIRDKGGNLYGATITGGAFGAGAVFKLSKRGETILYSFRGKADGASPGGLFRDAAGTLYGTTSAGGDITCNNGSGCGTLFKIDPTGRETVLHRFADSTTDGGYPAACLVRDAKGDFYGATFLGGTSSSGTVFRLDTAGKVTVVYNFTGGSGGQDGINPNGVILDAAGNLYGTTVFGGAHTWGTVFMLDPTGKETVLYSFAYGADGGNPMGGLVRDAAGNLYGTTQIGGGPANAGTIFKVDPTGKETVLHSFSQPGDGGYPQSGMVRDGAGNLYGSTTLGGTIGDGTVFKYDTAGNETVLHSFGGANDGQYPGDLTLDAAGHIYGTTQQGGTADWGTVFKIVP
jgi:uncharacterized repeat protein (TIGR03803 family)